MILPNQLTTLRIFLTPVFLYLFLSDNPIMKQLSLAVFIIAAITDWYDGWLARKFDYITTWGKFLDPLADKILTSTAFLAFAFTGIVDLWMVLIIIFRDILITLLRIYAEYKGYSFVTSKSAKVKTFLQMVFIYYLLLVFTFKTVSYIKLNFANLLSQLSDATLIYYSMAIVTLITFVTGVQYILNNRTLIKKLFNFGTNNN